jgi:hypothetical protein
MTTKSKTVGKQDRKRHSPQFNQPALARAAQDGVAVYAPFGDKGPFFHVKVDGREASLQPAQQSLEQAEQIMQQQAQQQKLEAMQQNPQVQRSAQLSM